MAQGQNPYKDKARLIHPYFPRAEAVPSVFLDSKDLSDLPPTVGPVFNPEHANRPLEEFNLDIQRTSYGEVYEQDHPPPRPEHFSDSYLFPTLSQNERLRLTMLWYYTRHINEDKQLLQRLHALVNTTQQFFGWESAAMSFIDEAVYTPVATANMEAAILPRREVLCAHAINQRLGSVFMTTSMHKDWRFEQAPPVKIGGKRSFAGTQLRLKTDHGEDVALGSLCVLSTSVQKPLTSDQKASLVRFADMLVSEVVSSTRQTRSRTKQIMADLLASLQSQTESNDFESIMIDTVHKIYPNAYVTVQDCMEGTINVEGRPPFSISEAKDGLWEDTQYIDFAIQTQNFRHLQSAQTIRAIIGHPGRTSKVLVVASDDMHLVFDDYDAWFVERCAIFLGNFWQHHYLQNVLKAKEAFMRGITHQLRTPIHGVLASTELLAEELTSRGIIDRPNMSPSLQKASACASTYISAIRNSGQELMSTVNNVLKLNRWAEKPMASPKAVMYDLSKLESDILEEVLLMVPEERLRNVAIIFDIQLSTEQCAVVIDPSLFKECLQFLLLNALQATEYGTVTLRVSALESLSTFQVDIVDTGRGIKSEDKERIFDAYEKASLHTAGVGLGLTLASKIAEVLHGSITLESSVEGRGSHFRAQFRHVVHARCECSEYPPLKKFKNLPQSFFRVQGSDSNHMLNYLATHMEKNGIQSGRQPPGSLILAESSSIETHDLLSKLLQEAVVICVFQSTEQANLWKTTLPSLKLIPAIGPFYTSRLDEVLSQVDKLFETRNIDNVIAETRKLTLQTHDSDASTITVDPASDLELTNGTTPPTPSTPGRSTVTRALLVDDNAINLRIFRLYCEKRQIPYVLAADGNEAVEQYKLALSSSQSIDLILMDLQMPHCDGITASKEIRRIEAEGKRDPSVLFIVTGQDSADDKDNSVEVGANEFLVKPVSLKTMDKIIGRYFVKHRVE